MAKRKRTGPPDHGGLAGIIESGRAPGAACWDPTYVFQNADVVPKRYPTAAHRQRFLTARGLAEV